MGTCFWRRVWCAIDKGKALNSLCMLEDLFSEFVEQKVQHDGASTSESNDSDESASFEEIKINNLEDFTYNFNFDFEEPTESFQKFLKQDMDSGERSSYEEPKWLS